MNGNAITIYFKALQRLIDNKPDVLPKGTSINNDAVSLEAGRKKGSIKKSRPEFKSLIEAICNAAEFQKTSNSDPDSSKIKHLENELRDARKFLADSHEREASLVYEVYSLREKLSKLSGDRIFPIRKRPDSNGCG